MTRLRLLAVLALGAIGVMLPSAASAQSYQFDQVTNTTPAPGETVGVHGNGFAPNSTVTVSITCDGTSTVLGQLVADDDGVVDGNVAIPTTADGDCVVTLAGVDPNGAPRELTFDVTVASAGVGTAGAGTGGSGVTGSLPFTGGDPGTFLAAGGVATVLGASIVTGARRRRASRASA